MASNPGLVRNIADLGGAISKELDALADRAYELHKKAKALQDRAEVRMVDTAVQADSGSTREYKLDRAARLASFQYLPHDSKLNWKKIRAMDLDKMARETDTRPLTEMFMDVATCDLEGESAFNLTEANLVKLVRVSQMMLQFSQHRIEQQMHVNDLLQEERDAAVAALKRLNLGTVGLKPVEDGLVALEKEFHGVADADMDAMFQQVRSEERQDARRILGEIARQAQNMVSDRTGQLVKQSLTGTRGVGDNSYSAATTTTSTMTNRR